VYPSDPGGRLQRLIVTSCDRYRSAFTGISLRDSQTYTFVAACYNRYSFFETLSIHMTSFGVVYNLHLRDTTINNS
jgi:hypothetical protein